MRLLHLLLTSLFAVALLPASVVGVPCVSPSDTGCAPVLNWAVYNSNNALLGDGSVRLSGFTANFGDGSVIPGDGSVRQGDGSVRLGDGSVLPASEWLTQASFGTPETFQIGFTGHSRANPFFNFALGVINSTNGPLSVTVSFLQPLAAGNWTQLLANSQSIITDGPGGDEGSASAQPGAGFSAIHFATLNAADVPGTGLGDGCAFVRQLTVNSTTTCDAFSQISVPISASGPGTFGLNVRLIVSARDLFGSEGRVELSNGAVPEPGTWSLLVCGAAALLALRRR